jgi:hypothetical protein
VAPFTSCLMEGKRTEMYWSISGHSVLHEIIILRISKFV